MRQILNAKFVVLTGKYDDSTNVSVLQPGTEKMCHDRNDNQAHNYLRFARGKTLSRSRG